MKEILVSLRPHLAPPREKESRTGDPEYRPDYVLVSVHHLKPGEWCLDRKQDLDPLPENVAIPTTRKERRIHKFQRSIAGRLIRRFLGGIPPIDYPYLPFASYLLVDRDVLGPNWIFEQVATGPWDRLMPAFRPRTRAERRLVRRQDSRLGRWLIRTLSLRDPRFMEAKTVENAMIEAKAEGRAP